jgi:hypothetical protein
MAIKPKEILFPVKKLVNLTEELAEEIAEFRHEHRIPSENEAVRRLIEMGLKAAPRPGPPRRRKPKL